MNSWNYQKMNRKNIESAAGVVSFEDMIMEWVKITNKMPPLNVWLEFYDGDKTMGHHPPFNHIDILNKRGEATVHYIHNYTHWRPLTAPSA